MSLVQFFPKEVPQSTRDVVEHKLAADHICRFLGEKAQEIFDEAVLAGMYHYTGRGAVNPVLMSIVVILQIYFNLSDRQAAEAATMRLEWLYALRQDVSWEGFHYSTICNYRKRLHKHGHEYLIFNQALTYLSEAGHIKTSRVRTDATHMLGPTERLNRLELLWETLRLALVALLKIDKQWAHSRLTAAFVDMYGERRSSFRLSQRQVAQLMKEAGGDGFFLLDQIKAHGEADWLELPAIETLAKVLDEQFERGEADDGSGRQVKARRKSPSDAICSPHDPDVRHGVKGGKGWDGHKVQLTETIDGDIPAIVDIAAHSAAQNDSKALSEIQDRLEGRGIRPDEQYVDGGYCSGDTIESSGERNIELVGKVRNDTRKEPGFRRQDFDVDKEKRRAVCPEGKESASFNESQQGDVEFHVRFGKQCLQCPSKPKCTSDKRGRTLELSIWDDTIMRQRERQSQPGYKKRTNRRARIESAFSEMTRMHGMRRSRYKGKNKAGLQLAFTAVAVNLKRIARHLA